MRGWSHTNSFLLLCSNLFAHRWKPLVSEDSSLLPPGPSTPPLSWKCGIISKTKLSYRWTAAVQTNHMWAGCKFPSHLLSMGSQSLCGSPGPSLGKGPAVSPRQVPRWDPWQPPQGTRQMARGALGWPTSSWGTHSPQNAHRYPGESTPAPDKNRLPHYFVLGNWVPFPPL